jgi:hypothetical protein
MVQAARAEDQPNAPPLKVQRDSVPVRDRFSPFKILGLWYEPWIVA